MNTLAKVGIGLGLIGLLVYAVKKGAQEVVEGIKFRILGIGVPEVNGSRLTVPVKVLFTNSSPITIPIDKLIVVVGYLKNGILQPAGRIDRTDLEIKLGDSEITFDADVDLTSLTNNLLDTLNTFAQNMAIDLAIGVAVEIKGIVATQEFEKRIKL